MLVAYLSPNRELLKMFERKIMIYISLLQAYLIIPSPKFKYPQPPWHNLILEFGIQKNSDDFFVFNLIE